MWVQSLVGEVRAGRGAGRGPLLEDGPRGLREENSTPSISSDSSQRLAQPVKVFESLPWALGKYLNNPPPPAQQLLLPTSPPKDPPLDGVGKV